MIPLAFPVLLSQLMQLIYVVQLVVINRALPCKYYASSQGLKTHHRSLARQGSIETQLVNSRINSIRCHQLYCQSKKRFHLIIIKSSLMKFVLTQWLAYLNLNQALQMKDQSLTGNANQRNSTRSQRKSSINSSRPEQKRQANDFLKYLNSEPSEMMESKQLNESTKTFELEQKHYRACPELYESYRTESCIEELKGDHFTILKYSKGRNEFRFGDLIEVEIPNVVKLTVWSNGDYKLIYNEQVYFWHEEEKCLDKYCVAI